MTPGQLHHQNTSMHYDSEKLYPWNPYAIFRYIYHGVISSLAIDHCFLYLSFVDLLDLGYSAVLCISLLTWDRTFKLGGNCYTTLLYLRLFKLCAPSYTMTPKPRRDSYGCFLSLVVNHFSTPSLQQLLIMNRSTAYDTLQ